MTERPAHNEYRMAAEWEPQSAVYLSWPLNPETWRGVRASMERAYATFAAVVTRFEPLYINCVAAEQSRIRDLLSDASADMTRVTLLDIPTNDAWCRDHGPVFLRGPNGEKAAVKFIYNAWGAKFAPWDLDDAVPVRLSEQLGFPLFRSDLVCEGGALETNGAGFLLTTENVILNANRNPGLTREAAEEKLKDALGVTKIGWLESGLAGDDTDGHVDTLARFHTKDSVLAAVDRQGGVQHDTLARNFMNLCKMRLPDGGLLSVEPLPCPEPLYSPKGDILPATYANFLILNGAVVMPAYRQEKADAAAADVLAQAFPGREIVAVDCCEILQEGGAVHCLSQESF